MSQIILLVHLIPKVTVFYLFLVRFGIAEYSIFLVILAVILDGLEFIGARMF